VATLQSDLVCHFTLIGAVLVLIKLLANPTLLGLIGFLVPYTSTILILCGFQGAVAPQSLVGLSGDYYFFGAIAMVLAGIAEFILGNSTSISLQIRPNTSDHSRFHRTRRRRRCCLQLVPRLPQRIDVSHHFATRIQNLTLAQGHLQLRLPHRHHTRQPLLHFHVLRSRDALLVHRRRRLLSPTRQDRSRRRAHQHAAEDCWWVWVYWAALRLVPRDPHCLRSRWHPLPFARA
jgi:hypothetical protein